MSREKFEELPEIKERRKLCFYDESANRYVPRSWVDYGSSAYLNGAWLIWQEQQKVVDELTAENQKLALANTKYFNGNKEYFLKLNALNKVLNHAIDGFYGHEHEGVCLNNLIHDLKLAFSKESEP